MEQLEGIDDFLGEVEALEENDQSEDILDELVKQHFENEENQTEALEGAKPEIKIEPKEEGEQTVRTRRQNQQSVDVDICRTCTSKENLMNIFEADSTHKISDLVMKICTTVRITARDHLPHKICRSCVEKVRIAYEFKTICENTDKELRSTIKRGYSKSRKASDYVLVNCPISDGEDRVEEPRDDEEYKAPKSEVDSEAATSDGSFAPPNKKKRTPKRRSRKTRSAICESATPTSAKRGRSRQSGTIISPPPESSSTPSQGRPRGRPRKSDQVPGIANVVFIEAPKSSSSDSDDDKPLRSKQNYDSDDTLSTAPEPQEHLQTTETDLFACTKCDKSFKSKVFLTNHLQRHDQNEKIKTKKHDCTKCDDTFSTAAELREHLQAHKTDLFPCTICDKTFKYKVYLTNHLERHDQDEKKREEKLKAKELKKQQQREKDIQRRKEAEERIRNQKAAAAAAAVAASAEKKKKVDASPGNNGTDLFKTVAPLTSTYWSDSFSD